MSAISRLMDARANVGKWQRLRIWSTAAHSESARACMVARDLLVEAERAEKACFEQYKRTEGYLDAAVASLVFAEAEAAATQSDATQSDVERGDPVQVELGDPKLDIKDAAAAAAGAVEAQHALNVNRADTRALAAEWAEVKAAGRLRIRSIAAHSESARACTVARDLLIEAERVEKACFEQYKRTEGYLDGVAVAAGAVEAQVELGDANLDIKDGSAAAASVVETQHALNVNRADTRARAAEWAEVKAAEKRVRDFDERTARLQQSITRSIAARAEAAAMAALHALELKEKKFDDREDKRKASQHNGGPKQPTFCRLCKHHSHDAQVCPKKRC